MKHWQFGLLMALLMTISAQVGGLGNPPEWKVLVQFGAIVLVVGVSIFWFLRGQ